MHSQLVFSPRFTLFSNTNYSELLDNQANVFLTFLTIVFWVHKSTFIDLVVKRFETTLQTKLIVSIWGEVALTISFRTKKTDHGFSWLLFNGHH
jgi:hypothetical protein